LPLRPFTIVAAASTQEAVAALQEYGDRARLYAGGSELLLVMKQKIAHFEYLIDVKGIPGLSEIAVKDGCLQVGGLCTHRQIELSPVVREHLPFLSDVERDVANIRVRNVGTIGGNLCFAEPHSDLGLVAALLNATIHVAGPNGDRTIKASEFFLGPYTTTMEPNEILTRIDLPLLPPGSGHSYMRFRFHERPSVAVGVLLAPGADGRSVAEARVGIGCAGPVPTRVAQAETPLIGLSGQALIDDEGPVRAAGEAAAAAIETSGDFSGSAEYKSHLISVYVARAVREAAARMLGGKVHV
jgi:carbon-monoxide dehydrogenase medium subunit